MKGYRKFSALVLVVSCAFIGLMFGKIDGPIFSQTIIATLGLFIGGNYGEHHATSKAGTTQG